MTEAQQFAEAVCAKIRKDMNDYCDDMANGGCRSFEEYKELCGRIRGLAMAEDYVKALAKKVETDDDQSDPAPGAKSAARY